MQHDPRKDPRPGDVLVKPGLVVKVLGVGKVFEVNEFRGSQADSKKPGATWFRSYFIREGTEGAAVPDRGFWEQWAQDADVVRTS